MKVETIEDSYELSPMQQGMLFNSLIAQNSGVDIEQIICSLHENLNISAFKRAWQRVLKRHPVLRTSFQWEGDKEPLQYVHRRVSLPLEKQDWRGLAVIEQQERLQAYLQGDRRRGFQLTEAPLMRLALFRVSESDYQFIWTFHHAMLDGRSLPIVLKEFFAFYDAYCQSQDLQLEKPPDYRNHIKWLQQQDCSSAEGYWRQLLKGFTAPTPVGGVAQAPKAGIQEESGFGEQEIQLSLEHTSMLQSLAAQNQLTLNTLLQGAWALLLSRYSGEADVVFGATRACRRSSVAESESMVGVLINTLPVRVSVPPEMSLLPWLKDLRSQWIALRDYEHTPLIKIQGWSDLPGGTPLFNSIVVFENYLLNSALRSQGGRWENLEVQLWEQTNYSLTLLGYAEPELLIKLRYDRRRFDDATVARMLGHINTLLESMATNPWQCLAELPLLTVEERYQMLVGWNDTRADYPKDLCIHQLFEAQVELTPDAVAVVFEDEQLTYRELNHRANKIAHHLKQLGVAPGLLVAIYLERSLEMIPALLGILKAGGAYVPLEPSFPKARIQWLLSSLKINCVVTQHSQLPLIDELQQQLPTLKHLICLDTWKPNESIQQEVRTARFGHWQIWTPSDLERLPVENLQATASSNDIAYVIFTSGSTGTPKGVVVRHQPVINLINWVNKTFDINASDRVLFITSLCFDLSVYDVFGLLAAGGSIRVVSKGDVRDPVALLRILGNEPITFWDSAPPALQQLVPFFPSLKSINNSQLRLVFLSGDWIPMTLPDLVKTAFPGVEVISLGGATEATVWSNYYPIKDVEPQWVSIPYGKPIQNAQYYILDSYLNPCPIGVPGELYIGGECLSSGYFNEPVLTAAKFIPNPFEKSKLNCLYKTGDLARYLPDGNIEFLGRIDHQVKIRGFRIELGEIEAVLAQHTVVQYTVVLAREDIPGDKRLVAYVVVNQKPAPAINELRRFLEERLPEYMVPGAFVLLDTMPLTPNGKIDRRALPAPNWERSDLSGTFVAPQDLLELQLTQIWEKVLGIKPIGVKDNFFELGGHSLLALRLFTQIKESLGKELPLATLFQAPTVEQLASILRCSGYEVPIEPLVPLQLGSGKPPLFCIYGILLYHDLARNLGTNQPVYGVYIQEEVDLLKAGRLDKKLSALTNIPDLASLYLKQIRALQPVGPYFLAGESFGGLVAFEMAHQLQAQGEKVALLALFDTQAPGSMSKLPLRQRLCLHLSKLLQTGSTYALQRLERRINLSKNKLLGIISRICGKFDQESRHLLSYLQEFAQRDLRQQVRNQAVRNYLPQPYLGKVVLFRAMNQSQFDTHHTEPKLWDPLVPSGLEVYDVPGDHIGILRKPHVQVLAAKLKTCLDREQSDNTEFITKEMVANAIGNKLQ